jgi:hypothetical protein
LNEGGSTHDPSRCFIMGEFNSRVPLSIRAI